MELFPGKSVGQFSKSGGYPQIDAFSRSGDKFISADQAKILSRRCIFRAISAIQDFVTRVRQ
jgi:hypothetical protein